MINSRRILIAAVMAAAGVVAFLYFSQSDTALIKKRFNLLAENLEKEGRENELISAAKARRIANMMAEVCRVNIPAYDVSRNISRDEVQPNVMMARARYQIISVDFYDFGIRFPAADRAEVIVTLFLKATAETGENVREIHELVSLLEKDADAGWLITGIEVVEVLER